jgi:hypothetical protein
MKVRLSEFRLSKARVDWDDIGWVMYVSSRSINQCTANLH